MNHLCRRPKSRSFAGAVIQSVFEHFNIRVVYVFHCALLGQVLAQQTIEVLIRPTLPTSKGPGEVARALQRFINPSMSAELFSVVVCQRLDPGLEGRERLDDRLAYQVHRFV